MATHDSGARGLRHLRAPVPLHFHDDALKKVPKGFDPDHPRAEVLKRKSVGVSYPALAKKLLASKDLLPWLVEHAKTVVPLVEWLVFATA